MHPQPDIRPAIAQALARGGAVVALETTLISHGLPYPENIETALAMEAAVRDGGAEPATVGIVDGRIRIGLTGSELALFARSDTVRKTSRRDLAIVCARGGHGATTVAATMVCACRAGIAVFATGGIGGVHRDVAATMDISADLDELARTPVAVVCSGAKAILDLPRTMQALETRGVPVIGYRTDFFPAFLVRSSGLAVDQRVAGAEEAAAIMHAHWALGLGGGLIIANPVPAEAAMDPAEIEACVDQARSEADALEVTGAAVTPFLLRRINEMTGNRSLLANVALLKDNAGAAAEVAVAYARQGRGPRGSPPGKIA